MIKVKINVEKTIDSFYSEDELLDLSKIESIYQIRALKACLEFQGEIIEVKKINDYSQAWIEKHQIHVYVEKID